MSFNSIRLLEAINRKGMTQAELVAITGISKASISRYVSGDRIPKQEALYKIARALDVSEAWLMGLEAKMDRPLERKIAEGIEGFTEHELRIVYDMVMYVKEQRNEKTN